MTAARNHRYTLLRPEPGPADHRGLSASAPLPGLAVPPADTPQCPPGLPLQVRFNGSRDAFFAAGELRRPWSAHGFGYLGPAPALTAYGYCLAVSDAV